MATKRFNERREIAERLQQDFLECYFGRNKAILAFALKLIEIGERDAAKSLNRAVSVLGEQLDQDRVIKTIVNKHQLAEKLAVPLAKQLREGRAQFLCGTSEASALFAAISHNDETLVGRLLKQQPLLVGIREGGTGNTPLHRAIGERSISISRLLIESGAPVDWKNNFGKSILDFLESDPSMTSVREAVLAKMRTKAAA